jgi:hypothetical protein
VIDPTHYAAVDAAMQADEAARDTALLTRLARFLPPPLLAALKAHPDQLARLRGGLDASGFATDAEGAVNAVFWAVTETLQAVGAVAGSVAAAQKNMTSTAAREARNARIVALWFSVGKNASERARVQMIRRRLGRYAPSRSTILRVVMAARK